MHRAGRQPVPSELERPGLRGHGGIGSLVRGRDPGVDAGLQGRSDRGEHGIAGERMLECEHPPVVADDARIARRVESLIGQPGVEVEPGGQHQERELLAQGGRSHQQVAGVRRQAVQPSADDRLHRVRNLTTPTVALAEESGQLHQEERVAAGGAAPGGNQVRGPVPGARDVSTSWAASSTGSPVSRTWRAPRRAMVISRSARAPEGFRSGPAGDDHRQALPGARRGGQVGQRPQAGRIGPVQVVDDQQQRLPRGAFPHQAGE